MILILFNESGSFVTRTVCYQTLWPQDGAMQDPEEKKISADMEEIIKNIDSIIERINHQDPGKAEEMQHNEDLPA